MIDTQTRFPVLGAILAGGESRRFGAPKALAMVGGWRLVERVHGAVSGAAKEAVLIANEPNLFLDLPARVRKDETPGVGALGGICTALAWAKEEGFEGALCVAVDLPFVSSGLLRALVARAAEGGADAVVPESGGPRGFEPLCAYYSVRCLDAARRLVSEGEHHAHALLDRVPAVRLTLEEVGRTGDPRTLFYNVNTPEDLKEAIRMASAASDG